ncbi:hypothetical protein, partial [Occallatibacter savannae]|uniref:hypothetical protein n=1 Tax=Occallatibacter savannae TaxID=1002691 RepID=UPI00194F371F
SYTFWHGRIGEIRPLILLGLGRAFLEGFCHTDNLLVDVVDDTSLAAHFVEERFLEGTVLVEFTSQVLVDLLKASTVTIAVAEGRADEEAGHSREQHPERYEVSCRFLDHATLSSEGWLARTRRTVAVDTLW